jgi:hypothetical protein
MVVFGSRLYGKVDAIPGLGHVATKFGHLNFVPLIPMESWFVVGEQGDGWRGKAIPMSAKSVLVAWGRTLVCVGLAISLFMSAMGFLDPMKTGALGSALMTVCFAAATWFMFTWKRITHASPERARELAALLEVSEQELDRLTYLQGEPMPAPAVAAPARPWTPPES